jgi:hypothetical protein
VRGGVRVRVRVVRVRVVMVRSAPAEAASLA